MCTDTPDLEGSGLVDHGLHPPAVRARLPRLETRSELGIYISNERARQLETGSYGETSDSDDVEEEFGTYAQSAPVEKPAPAAAPKATAPASVQVHSSAELMQEQYALTVDAPFCISCGTKLRPAGSCYIRDRAAAPAAVVDQLARAMSLQNGDVPHG